MGHILDHDFKNVRKPFLEAESLPPECYTDQKFFDREIETIFKESWLFVGRDEKIPNTGDFFVIDLLGHSIIITRSADGAVNAFHNICSHRGAHMLDGHGNAKLIRCPYHSWAYSPGGELVRAPDMEQTCSFNPDENGLQRIELATWAGFIFVNFANKPAALLDQLGDLPDRFAPYNIADMVCIREREDIVDTNWKLYQEVDMEDYHAPSVHPESIGQQVFPRLPSNGNYETTFFEFNRSVSVMSTDKGKVFPHIKGISGKCAEGTHFTMIYPGFFLVNTLDSMWWINKIPISPEKTYVRSGFCFPKATTERADFDEISARYNKRWDLVVDEDNEITARHQKGIRSPYAKPGRLSFHEEVVNAMNIWVLDKVLEK